MEINSHIFGRSKSSGALTMETLQRSFTEDYVQCRIEEGSTGSEIIFLLNESDSSLEPCPKQAMANNW